MLVLKCFPLQVFINLTTPKGCDPDLNPAQDPEKKLCSVLTILCYKMGAQGCLHCTVYSVHICTSNSHLRGRGTI